MKGYSVPWWHPQMETFSALLAFCRRNSPFTGEFPSQMPMTRSFNVFCHLRLNKRLRRQSWGWWFQTQSRLWRHCSEGRRRNLSTDSLDLIERRWSGHLVQILMPKEFNGLQAVTNKDYQTYQPVFNSTKYQCIFTLQVILKYTYIDQGLNSSQCRISPYVFTTSFVPRPRTFTNLSASMSVL